MTNPNALLLLADHIKLSLLEQQRAKTLNLRRDSQDGHISRSLDQFREGLEALEKEHQRLQEAGDESKAASLSDTLASLRKQYADLSSQFHGRPSPAATSTLTQPNDPSLAADFAHAQSSTSSHPAPQKPTLLPQPQPKPTAPPPKKHLIDDDTAGYRAHIAAANLSNAQIHAYHRQILDEQDAQLDALGASIARQRELSLRIGDELDSQVELLDESERAVDRQAGALGRARRQVGRIARGAARSGEGRQLGAIVALIVILVLLIVILK
ncbi:4632b3d9-3b79-4872-b97d-72a37737e983 [Thermothielavioides terrestris]|uniref:4632b3d9-3b79-4872-b97d-72a37737e983 n=1 Tax=Thermothielavioides terrestris TaxID=2587410 RepID=A0A3S4C3D4_9PEZI|nr:4632b3d9-3b79-4872-b97d-72a37737e983 [Thermothielavioides terrestris]